MIEQILSAIKGQRFDLQNEKELQKQIGESLSSTGLIYSREHQLSKKDIIDFFLPDEGKAGIGLELKIKGTAKAIYKQLDRYCQHHEITHIILVTNRTMGLPKLINNKPAYIINLGKAWL